jgi:hypothetical protein
MTLDKEIIRKNRAEWFAAMRSGEYEQTTHRLKTPEGYCCFGVLCDLAVKRGLGKWIHPSTDDSRAYSWYKGNGEDNSNSEMAPISLVQSVGIPYWNPEMFAEMNDTGSTFEEIMEAIDREYPL